MTTGDTPPHKLSDRLGFRLGVVLSMALLPVGLIAVIQSDKILNEVQAHADAALVGETLRAVAPGMRLVRQAQGAASVLAATVPSVLSQPSDACPSMLRAVAPAGAMFTAAEVIDPAGRVICSSVPSAQGTESRVSGDILAHDQPMLARRPGPPPWKGRSSRRQARSGMPLVPGSGPWCCRSLRSGWIRLLARQKRGAILL
ncbi:MAG: hypothetical protein RLZZ413_2742 [Pseudomonadota bacterium]